MITYICGSMITYKQFPDEFLKELDDLLMKPENASNMEFVTEYTTTKKALDEEVERWERLSEELEQLSI